MVASREFKYSTSDESASTYRARVITTPHGMGAPMNLWPETEMEPMGLRKETSGAAWGSGGGGVGSQG